MQLLETFARHMGIYLRRRNIRMPQQHLHYPQICPMIEQVGSECMAQYMGRHMFGDPRQSCITFYQIPESLPRHPFTALCDKDRIG